MESRSSIPIYSKWCNLPSDILLVIAKKLDENDVRQLGAVCTGWNSSLAIYPTKTHSNFPLEIPCPIIPTLGSQEKCISLSKRFTFWVVQRRVLLVSPFKKSSETSAVWITTIEESGLQKWSVFNSLTGYRISPCSCTKQRNNDLPPEYINLFYFKITEITKSYSLMWVDREGCYHTHSCSFDELIGCLNIKKVIAFQNSTCTDEDCITVVFALLVDGKLAYWKSGCQEWNILDSLEFNFVDVILYDDKFHVVDIQGNLTIIDPLTFETIESFLGDTEYYFRYEHLATYLVQREQLLYLIMFKFDGMTTFETLFVVQRFVLTEHGWVTDRGLGGKCVTDSIFFFGTDVTFSVPRKHLGWPRGNLVIGSNSTGLSRKSLRRHNIDLFMDMNSESNKSSLDFYNMIFSVYAGFYSHINTSFEHFEFYRQCCDFCGLKSLFPPLKWVRHEASLESSDTYDLKCDMELCMDTSSQVQRYDFRNVDYGPHSIPEFQEYFSI